MLCFFFAATLPAGHDCVAYALRLLSSLVCLSLEPAAFLPSFVRVGRQMMSAAGFEPASEVVASPDFGPANEVGTSPPYVVRMFRHALKKMTAAARVQIAICKPRFW